MKPLLIGEIKQATRAHARTAITEHLVGGVSTDSRTTRKGEVFFALRGEHFDGHAFIDQAVAAGGRGDCGRSQCAGHTGDDRTGYGATEGR